MHCARIFYEMTVPCVFLEYRQKEISFIKKAIHAMGMPYYACDARHLADISQQKGEILIVSVNNTYLFPPKTLACKNITIINYHNSLLPRHRGMHAEAWAIYDNDEETGITWHMVDSGIDTGDVIIQRKIPIADTMTSLSLLAEQTKSALNALRESLPDILHGGNIQAFPQARSSRTEMHRKGDIPNGGELHSDWPDEKIWSFLRAMDYGGARTLGTPRVHVSGKWYSWRKYQKIRDTGTFPVQDNKKTLLLKNTFILYDIFEIA